MVNYRKHILDNGLTVLTHEAWDTPLATVNVLYGVGSRNEDPRRTGFAHLFEHLMFGGTKRVPDYDRVVSSLGGENNAFTNCDYTDYYVTVPADGLETALWLEFDRMQGLDLTQKALEVQQKVVTEEYHQRYMNQPYGDVWLLLRPLCYKVYPYRWATIGADIRHVSEATLEDVRAFHERWYRPQNAIVAIAAPLTHEAILRAVKGLTPHPPLLGGEGVSWVNNAPLLRGEGMGERPEPLQTAPRYLHVKRQVPSSMVYLAWPMGDRNDPLYRACDLVSDILGNGASSRLYDRLVRREGLFVEADACISGDAGPGLMVLSGKLADGVSLDEGADALRSEARRLADEGLTEYELQKVQNKYENTFVYSQYKAADRALSLCYYTWLGDTDLVNREPQEYRRVTVEEVQRAAQEVFRPERENRLDYEAER